MSHQLESIKFKLQSPIGANNSDVGTGKTAAMTTALQARWDQGDSKRTLWVTTKTMMLESAKEITKWSFLNPVVLSGTTKEKAAKLTANGTADCFFIINYDSLSLLEKELTKVKFDSIVCDESSAIKNHASQRNKALCRISKTATFRWAMTGTPMPNTVLDIYGQWKFIEPTLFGSITEFKREYCVYIDRGWPMLVGYKNLESLQKILAPRSIRIRRDDCIQLPGRTFITRDVLMEDEQAIAYRDLKEKFLCLLDESKGAVSAQGVLDQLTKLAQITSGFIKNDDGNIVDFSHNAKLEDLKNLLDECDVDNNKVIIWCVFKHTIKKLKQELKGLNPAILFGEIKAEDRSAELEKLRTDSTCKALIAQVATGEGFTINEAPISIYFEHDFSWKNRDQSLGRNYRLGQTRKVVVFDLVCPGTVDAAKLKALQSKKSIQDLLTGDYLKKVIEGQL